MRHRVGHAATSMDRFKDWAFNSSCTYAMALTATAQNRSNIMCWRSLCQLAHCCSSRQLELKAGVEITKLGADYLDAQVEDLLPLERVLAA
jgi:hypothetical protein